MSKAESHRARYVSYWLFAVCFMIFVMVVIGGVTRLTESGLSITEWKPISGIVPPMNETQWAAQFEKYKQIPEYSAINSKMTLDEYKTIFWWEYAHRLWGRLIGLAYVIPLILFWSYGYLNKDWKIPLVILLFLGANQGFLGWFMVQSGLDKNIDVSAYRLTLHLGMAFLIYSYMLWVALHLRSISKGHETPQIIGKIRQGALALFALFILTFTYGGFVAGLNAGLMYNTFPLMDGQLVPPGLFAMKPWFINFFENATLVQFMHRLFAVTFVAVTLIYGIVTLRRGLPKRAKVALIHVMAMAVVQASLGIETLLRHVPITLAALHQAGAVLMLTCLVWYLFEIRRDKYSIPQQI